MTEHTPTTERVKDSYVWFRDEVTADTARVEFDRWLEQVTRNAWARGYNEGYSTAEKRSRSGEIGNE